MGYKKYPEGHRLATDECWAKAFDDEMLFILMARDFTAPEVVIEWIKLNLHKQPPEKLKEAFECAMEMVRTQPETQYCLSRQKDRDTAPKQYRIDISINSDTNVDCEILQCVDEGKDKWVALREDVRAPLSAITLPINKPTLIKVICYCTPPCIYYYRFDPVAEQLIEITHDELSRQKNIKSEGLYTVYAHTTKTIGVLKSWNLVIPDNAKLYKIINGNWSVVYDKAIDRHNYIRYDFYDEHPSEELRIRIPGDGKAHIEYAFQILYDGTIQPVTING